MSLRCSDARIVRAKRRWARRDATTMKCRCPRAVAAAGGVAPKKGPSMQAAGYVRVSTDEQGASGAGLEAQRCSIVAECERRGWELKEVVEDVGCSGKDLR